MRSSEQSNMKITYSLSGSQQLLLLGTVSTLCCLPLLFREDRDDLKADSAYLHAVQSNQFENMVLITFALSIPSVLDVLADLFEKKSFKVLDDEHISRIFLALSLFSQPLLYLHFAIKSENLIATYAIKTVRGICCATIIAEQLYKRCGHMFTFKISFLMHFLWCSGCVVGAYGISTDVSSNVPAAVAMVLKAAGGIILMVTLGRHYASICKEMWSEQSSSSLSEHRYQKWHTVAFELLIILTLLGYSAIDLMYAGNDIYEYDEGYILGTAYLATFFQFLFSNLMTQQFRFELVVAKEKLAIKRQFVRYVSHEIRTPLNSCALGLGYLRHLCSTGGTGAGTGAEVVSSGQGSGQGLLHTESETMLTVIDEMTDCCETAVAFMNNMLFCDKLDSSDHHVAFSFKPENLRDICHKSYQAFLMSSRHLNIHFTYEAHELLTETPIILADHAKIMLVLRNLISNALKFSAPKGYVKLKIVPISKSTTVPVPVSLPVSAAPVQESPVSKDNATHYRVIVEDEGVGMSLHEQQELFARVLQFNPQPQAHRSGEGQGQGQELVGSGYGSGSGSGMGLYLSQQILIDHDTTLQVHSEGIRGKGSLFFIDFPKYVKNEAKKNLNPKQVLRQETGPTQSVIVSRKDSLMSPSVSRRLVSRPLSDLEVMIVDDSRITRKMVRRALEQYDIGGSFSEVGDGVELLDLMCPAVSQVEPYTAGTGTGIEAGIEAGSVLSGSGGRSAGGGANNKYKIHPTLQPQPSVLLKTYDIILMDKSMPLLNGDVATARLRELGYTGLIIGLTGNVLPEDLEEFCKMGANYAFSKPLDMEKFHQIMNDYFVV